MNKIKKMIRTIEYHINDIDEYNWLYKIVAILGIIIRTYLIPLLIPEPFELLSGILVGKLGLNIILYEILVRFILAIIDYLSLNKVFNKISYISAGTMYCSYSKKYWWGSLLYTFYYIIYMIIACLLILYFNWFAIISILIIYIIINVLLYYFSNKLDTFSDSIGLNIFLHIFFFVLFSMLIIITKIKFF